MRRFRLPTFLVGLLASLIGFAERIRERSITLFPRWRAHHGDM